MNLPHPTPSERRAHDRFPVRVAAQLLLPNKTALAARTLDIGKGGAAIVCDLNVPVGTRLEVKFFLPSLPSGSTLFEASANVVNCTLASNDGGFRLGLQFFELSSAASAALRGFLPQ